MTADMIAFFRARLDEIEARENGRWTMGEWHGKPCPVCLAMFDPDKPWTYVQRAESIEFGTALGPHGYTLHPCRHELTDEEFREWSGAQPAGDPYTLADVAAKRQIVRDIEVLLPLLGEDPEVGSEYRAVLVNFLQHLARPFAGHEDYQECWAP